jgi:hypothetical protein
MSILSSPVKTANTLFFDSFTKLIMERKFNAFNSNHGGWCGDFGKLPGFGTGGIYAG